MGRMPLKNALFLFGAALIWGVAFVAQSVGMDYMGPFTFGGIRFLMGSLVLMPFIYLRGRSEKSLPGEEKYSAGTGRTIAAGMICGTVLFAAAMLQQVGIITTDVGKAGFLTAMYIVIVPVLSFFITGRTSAKIWVSVGLATVGLYFLSIKDGFSLERGDMLLILCAFLFSLHIICIDYFSDVDPVKLSCVQFITAGLLASAVALVREGFQIRFDRAGIICLLYTGLLSTGCAYTFQIIGQNGADPAIASLLLSLESVISVIAGFLILHQALSPRELLGCAIMFVAIVLVQLPLKSKEPEQAV